jgi:orotate phosphoribosyltransferase
VQVPQQENAMTDDATTNRDRLLTLLRDRAFLRGDVTLASGAKSQVYIDGKMVELNPEGAYLIGEVLFDAIKDIDFDAVGGLAVGAVPVVTSLVISCYAHQKEIEGFFVRVEAKDHGTRRVIEGKLPHAARVIVVDDVVTSGKSTWAAIEAIENAGAKVVLALAIVDRQAGAREFFEKQGYPYRWIFTKDDVVAAAGAVSARI